ncbi:MAG TPA: C39 family peptidase [Ignavibacteriales bacterium]|nr:C39 family peptidase [Ignavibacteriales bacterium]
MNYRLILFFFLLTGVTFGQSYPDQHYFFEKDSLVKKIQTMSGMKIAPDGKSIVLEDGATDGYTIFSPDSSKYPFNEGLPSWNGRVSNENSSFKVLMRFYNGGWSPWLTVGYWKSNLWSSYGSVSFNGGKVDVDFVQLYSYCSKWQFQVVMKRTNAANTSASLHKLSFFVSDSRTTANTNITAIVNDKPAAIFIPTDHFYQYSLDPGIGGNICSPTSTSMVLRSYKIMVDPLQFAKDNYDTYWQMFGVWPKAVQNAAQYGLNGAVTRYRTWSETRAVMAAGGRVVMSVAKPLYTGHLIMLAGFNANGDPIVHDPARRDGYAYVFDKTALSQSWFNKGGVAYTFFPGDNLSTSVTSEEPMQTVQKFNLVNYPNPFNGQTTVSFETPDGGYTRVTVYDVTGREVERLYDGTIQAGKHSFRWNANDLPTGNYFIHAVCGQKSKTLKALLLK